MSTLLLKNIDTLATFDPERRILHGAWLLIRDQNIESMGATGDEPRQVDQSIDLTGHVVLPGLINTHHHLFQSLLRNLPALQDVALFDWLRVLYLLMSEVRDEDQYVASTVNHAELLLSGCTTNADHSYIKVNDMQHDTGIKAAQDIGIRFHLVRGGMSIGESKGGLPPDHIVENEDDILADTERLIQTHHDPKPGAMVRVDNAPCSPFSVSTQLMVESIELARRYEGVRNHTHLAECPDDDAYMQETYGKSSVYVAEDWGWVGSDVWYAHGVVLSDDEIELMARTGTGVTHCPNSNMYTAAGVCPVPTLLAKGAPVGLGVDGSAANNSSNMLDEVRSALLLQRVRFGADVMSPTQALEIATLGSARVLGRDDIGTLSPGKAADLIAVDMNRLSFSGGLHDPVAALVLCDAGHVDLSIVNGRIQVQDGRLVDIDLPALIDRQNRLAADLVRRTEKRYGIPLQEPVWRRAYPYDPMKS
jgi:cytosine/adenosine deaminase-related metal-dependent hydrolase